MSPVALIMVALLAAPTPFVGDLGGYLEESSTAEFSGEQLVKCETPDGPRDSLFQIAQADGVAFAWADGGDEVVVSLGTGVATAATSDEVDPAQVGVGPADLYETVSADPVTYLGRNAVEVSIERDGTERVRLVVDHDSGAVLRTRTLAADGETYCDRRLISFAPGAVGIPALDAPEPTTEALGESPSELPSELEGFTLVDTFAIEAGTLSYFSDGFFSFGVAMTDRPLGFPAGSNVVRVPDERGDYRRSYEAGRVTVAWTSTSGSLALIGDTPPDMTDEILAGLPAPLDPGFFERIWSRFFG